MSEPTYTWTSKEKERVLSLLPSTPENDQVENIKFISVIRTLPKSALAPVNSDPVIDSVTINISFVYDEIKNEWVPRSNGDLSKKLILSIKD